MNLHSFTFIVILLYAASGITHSAEATGPATPSPQDQVNEIPAPEKNFIQVADDQWTFKESITGKPFIPIGVNYYDPNTGWPPKFWTQFNEARTREHFAQMQECHVTVARVFLTRAFFMPTANAVEESAMRALDQLIAIAKEHQIKLILNGMEHWDGNPPWFTGEESRFVSEDIMAIEERFWETMATRYKNEETLFSWTLVNEPLIPWSDDFGQLAKWQAWVSEKYQTVDAMNTAWGKSYPDFGSVATPPAAWKPGDQTLYDYQLFREHLGDVWSKRMVSAIRKHDPNHMITLGFVMNTAPFDGYKASPQWHTRGFNPKSQSALFDYQSVHFYPLSGSYPFGDPFESKEAYHRAINFLKVILSYFDYGKPVILEEFGWYSGAGPIAPSGLQLGDRTEDEQAEIVRDMIVETTGYASGYIVWPMYDNLASTDLSKFAGLATNEGTLKKSGLVLSETFKNIATHLKPRNRLTDVAFEIDHRSLLTSTEYQDEVRSKLLEIVERNQNIDYQFK